MLSIPSTDSPALSRRSNRLGAIGSSRQADAPVNASDLWSTAATWTARAQFTLTNLAKRTYPALNVFGSADAWYRPYRQVHVGFPRVPWARPQDRINASLATTARDVHGGPVEDSATRAAPVQTSAWCDPVVGRVFNDSGGSRTL